MSPFFASCDGWVVWKDVYEIEGGFFFTVVGGSLVFIG